MTVALCDVGPRDGLQNEAATLAPARRAELANRLAAAGLRRVEAVAFVGPRVPQMAGAEDVVAGVEPVAGVTFAGLVLNLRGYERLAVTSLREARFAHAVTETFNRRNQNATPAESIAVAGEIAAAAARDGRRFSATLGASFGCPFEGAVAPDEVMRQAELLVAGGAGELVFADTIGVAAPREVGALVRRGRELGVPVGVHLHNTRNTGYANAYAALEAGASLLDASVGGLGGCPFAPRATGNVATEDLVYMLDREGVETGVDLAALIAVAEWLAGEVGHELPGQVHRAGPFPSPDPARSPA